MNIAFYTGVSGMVAYQEGLSVIANNVANVNTDGYKPAVEAFRDLVYTNMDTNGEEKKLLGHGVQGMGTNINFGQGNLRQTESALDYAIVGNGLFAALDGSTVKYTKNGSFGISVEGDENFLVAHDGSYILDAEGERIQIPYKKTTDAQGREVNSSNIDYNALTEKIGIYSFSNPYGLSPMNGTFFLPTAVSGEAVVLEGDQRDSVDLLTNALEASKVDLADQMVAVMKTQKAYQFTAKMVQTADEIENIVNNLR